MNPTPAPRTRGDLCPGVSRPWPAEDGALVRLRLIGGEIAHDQLIALSQVASRFGDGRLHTTARANLQLRGLPLNDGALPVEVTDAIAATGLLPHPDHELVRNVMRSPLSGLSGGLADLRPVARAFDDLLCSAPDLADLPGRFLVVLDDGRGDLQGRTLDLGAMAVDEQHAQLRAGSEGWGEVVPLDDVPARLVALARDFLALRGEGPSAAWHVDELSTPMLSGTRDPRTLRNAGPLPFGPFDGGQHLEVPDGVITADVLAALAEVMPEDLLVVSPWSGLVVADSGHLG
ncbi:MAG: ferredoxin-nitrite reductase [Marmoricola sp.]|nr:ferredoxin-nitrite reductase [Marmoricola sp.]